MSFSKSAPFSRLISSITCNVTARWISLSCLVVFFAVVLTSLPSHVKYESARAESRHPQLTQGLASGNLSNISNTYNKAASVEPGKKYSPSGWTPGAALSGNDAAFVSQSVPEIMTAGETYAVTVRMLNQGTTTWTPEQSYRLGSQNPQDNTTWAPSNRVNLLPGDSVSPGAITTFSFVVTAPSSPGSYNFQWQMVQDDVEWFGAETSNIAVQVVPRNDSATFISQTVPSVMGAGASYSVSITFKNTGNTTWTTANHYRLGSQNPEDNWIWGLPGRVDLESGELVAPGDLKTFSFRVVAPAAIGSYNFQWQMLRENVNWFGAVSTNLVITANATAVDQSQFVSQSVPSLMTPGNAYSVSVTIKNTGNTTWDSNYRLSSQNPTDNGSWGFARVYLASGETVPPGASKTFTFTVTTPTSPDSYALFQWRMVHEGVQWFGDYSPGVVVALSPAPPSPVPVPASLTSFANFQGASVIGDQIGIPTSDEETTIAKVAFAHHLNVLRHPFFFPRDSEPELFQTQVSRLRAALDAANSNRMRVIVILDGYSAYDTQFSWKAPFTAIKDNAAALVATFKDHPTLFAWDLQNEPIWGCINNPYSQPTCSIGAANEADFASISLAVHSMYALVRSVDPNALTTVGEGQVPASMLSRWSDVSSFTSPHYYSGLSTPQCDAATVSQMQLKVRSAVRQMKEQLGPVPLVLGEFGFSVPDQAADDHESELAYQYYYDILRVEGIGSMFWELSLVSNQQSLSLIHTDGSAKPAMGEVSQARPRLPANAAFVSQSVPTKMSRGQVYSVSVTLLNNGNTTWTWLSNYNLGSQNPTDNWTWGPRVPLNKADVIEPGQQKTFSFQVTAPAQAGIYHFQWQMLQEGVQWFGAITPDTLITVDQDTVEVEAESVSGSSVAVITDADASNQQAVTRTKDGIYTWWVLPNGTVPSGDYALFVRARSLDGNAHWFSEHIIADDNEIAIMGATVASGAYQWYRLGEFSFAGSSLRIADWSDPSMAVDKLIIAPIQTMNTATVSGGAVISDPRPYPGLP